MLHTFLYLRLKTKGRNLSKKNHVWEPSYPFWFSVLVFRGVFYRHRDTEEELYLPVAFQDILSNELMNYIDQTSSQLNFLQNNTISQKTKKKSIAKYSKLAKWQS